MPDTPQRPQEVRVPGTKVQLPPPSTRVITITESNRYRVNAARAGAVDAPKLLTAPDDVVEIELDDGTLLWTTRERLCSELIPPQERRGSAETYELPAGLSLQGPSRGLLGKILFKTLSFFKVADPPKDAARTIATMWENHVLQAQDSFSDQLYRCETAGDLKLYTDLGFRGNSWQKPLLLFLHGTASSTRMSFGELWGAEHAELRRQLFQNYEGNVLTLQHRTLTRSPVQNALVIAGCLPEGCRLHLVSHSRGGLIGELLCRGQAQGGRDPFTAEELEFFRRGDPEGGADLVKLNTLLKAKRFQVERFVRVACPARGTSLASDRLDVYLSVVFNLLKKIPLLKAAPAAIAYDIFSELVMTVAKERADATVLPGLKAMVPGSPLINLINRPDCQIPGELRVIAGDIEGDTVLSALKALLVHPLFLGDNDLVVDSEAMFGGMERSGGAAFSFHQGAQVSHFQYFKNVDSAARLLKALTRKQKEDDGFKPFRVRETDEGEPPYKRGDEKPRPVVYLLPGFMASHLDLADDRIWLDPTDLAFGALSQLKLDQSGVHPAEPLWRYYSALASYLAANYQVKPFPYDWRISAEREGARLAEQISATLDEVERTGLPVSVVAHSAGGMVARAMVAYRPQVWERMCRHPQARLIMLGTPWRGSCAVAQMLTGRDSLVKKLSLLDSRHSQKDILNILSSFPGLLELLPCIDREEPYRLFEGDFWKELHDKDAEGGTWVPPRGDALAAARMVREKLDATPSDGERMLYVAGLAPATPVDFAAEADSEGATRVVFHATAHGDGRVLWDQGLPQGMKVWYLAAYHGDLANHPAGFDAIGDLLKNGTTTRLPSTPPDVSGAAPRFTMPVEKAPLYPSFRDLAAAALGASRQTGKARLAHRARVSVLHGNIGYVDCPVLVGHYEGDTLVSAEAHLDRVLGGRLCDRHRLGLYPGSIETAEIFLDPRTDCQGGAIVVGLGEVGKLTPGKLMRTVSRGVRAYASALADRQYAMPLEGVQLARISPLLVGTSAGGISVEDSLTAILRGVSHANQMLHEGGYDAKVLVDEVQFIELFEDRAIQAAHALERVRTDPDIARCFLIEPQPVVRELSGGRRRASYYDFEDDSWWQRLQIFADNAERLAFNLLTDRAREEVYLLTAQKTLADRFVKEMIGAPNSTSSDLAVTLFEMLIPNEIKEYAPDRRNMVLVLNDAAAHYPWEMMQERRRESQLVGSEAQKPLSIQAGMVRQLQVGQFRERVMMARGQGALVVGNPRTTRFPPLPGAELEARKVCDQLESFGYKTTARIGADADSGSVMRALYEHDYRIIHLAGHGVYEYETGKEGACDCCAQQTPKKKITGMIIGDEEFLTPAQIRQMRVVPELVFVNCCTLGKVEEKEGGPLNMPPYLAANVASELIRMGVRAVVAAGWEVDDAAANLFAEVFYRHMLSSGISFGKAVLHARQAVYDSYPNTNTWGAYQCYGDPAFTLSTVTARSTRRRQLHFVAPAEVYALLNNMAEEASTASDTRRTELQAEVEEIEKQLPMQWNDKGEVCAALGRVYGELDVFHKAAESYRRACLDSKSRYPVKTIEQLWNLQARLAVDLQARDPAHAVEARKHLKESEERLSDLVKVAGKTAERLSLLGSVAKRQAMILPAKGKLEALERMESYYNEASGLCKDFYPLFNGLAAKVLLHLLGKRRMDAEEFAAQLESARDAAADAERQNRDFWSSIATPDSLILEHLYHCSLGEKTSMVVGKYQEICKCLGSPRELRSVSEHVAFLEEVVSKAPAEPGADQEKLKELAEALAAIRAGLAE